MKYQATMRYQVVIISSYRFTELSEVVSGRGNLSTSFDHAPSTLCKLGTCRQVFNFVIVFFLDFYMLFSLYSLSFV